MTTTEYTALPKFMRSFPKEIVEAQYASNAIGLRSMLSKAEQSGRKVGGFTADELRAKAERFEVLAVAR